MTGTTTFPPSRRRSLIALVLLLAAAPAPALAAQADDEPPSFTLYAAVDPGREYRPIDPLLLTDATGVEPLTFESEWTHFNVSRDGSTFVVIDPAQGPLEDWISVRDGVHGAERLSITVEEAVFNPLLSDDGSRLVVEPGLMCGPSGCDERVWYTYDTDTGELISTIRSGAGDPVWPDLIDPAGRRLYQPLYEGPWRPTYPATPPMANVSEVGPWPLRIAAYDLTAGSEIDRLTVPGVFAGSWQRDSTDDMYVGEFVRPAIAVSPDGTTIAVIDAPLETLTLIDAATLKVVETREVHAPESVATRLLTWLGIVPQTAEAKISAGRTLSATFSTDGRHLYVSGSEIVVGDTIEDIDGEGFGLMRIDVDNGEITGEALPGEELTEVIPSPDGRSIYVLGPETPWWESDSRRYSAGHVLHRLDARTLEPLAERRFSTWPIVELAPIAG